MWIWGWIDPRKPGLNPPEYFETSFGAWQSELGDSAIPAIQHCFLCYGPACHSGRSCIAQHFTQPLVSLAEEADGLHSLNCKG